MTRLRRARLAGALVALGMMYQPAVTQGLLGAAVRFVVIPGLTGSVIPEKLIQGSPRDRKKI